MIDSIKKIPSYIIHILSAMGGIILTMIGFWLSNVPSLITRAETIGIVAHEISDLDTKVREKLEAVDKLRESLDKNTTAVND